MSFFKRIFDSFSKGRSERRGHSPKLRIDSELLFGYPASSEGIQLLMNQVQDFAGDPRFRRRGSERKTPFRKLVLWGRDAQGNPGFLNIYGYHFKEKGQANYREEVHYIAMKIWEGCAGRFPSHHSVAFATVYSPKLRDSRYYMIEPRGRRFNYSYAELSPFKVQGFRPLAEESEILLPYFREIDYSRLAEALSAHLNDQGGFTIAPNYNQLFEFSEQGMQYLPLIVEMVQNERVYKRQKLLSRLCEMNPPQEVWERLLSIGGAELVSGIFMEFARRRDKTLLTQAEDLLSREKLIFVSEEEDNRKIAEGVRQSIRRYLLTFAQEEREERAGHLAGEVEELFAQIEKNSPVPLYCPMPGFKHAIQEMESFGEAELLGKIAFLLDQDKITFRRPQSIQEKKTRLYFHRKIRRIADRYAKDDKESYLRFLLSMLRAYEGKRESRGRVPIFLKKYLYTEFFEGRVNSASDWYGEKTAVLPEVLLAAEERLEAEKALWENHIEELVALLPGCREELILRFVQKILRDSSAGAAFLESLSFEALLPLSELSYAPLAEIFAEELRKRPPEPVYFLYLLVMGKEDAESFDFSSLSEEERLDFLRKLYENSFGALAKDRVYSQEIREIFGRAAASLRSFSSEGKRRVAEILCEAASAESFMEGLSPFLSEFTERLVCSLELEQMQQVMQAGLYPKTHYLPLLIEDIAAGRLPEDQRIERTLEQGAPETLGRLQALLFKEKDSLKERPSALLLLMESGVSALRALAQSLVVASEEKQREESLRLLLDSPDKETVDFACTLLREQYGKTMPAQWVLRMMEHSRPDIRAYAAEKIRENLSFSGSEDPMDPEKGELVLGYIRSLLLLPNRAAKAKESICKGLPVFVRLYPQARERVESLLLDLGGSHTKKDAERALVALARIRKEENA